MYQIGLTQHRLPTQCRLVGLPCAGTKPLDLEVFYEAFKGVYKKLVAEEPIVCDHTGTVMPGTRAPDAAILDVSCTPHLSMRPAWLNCDARSGRTDIRRSYTGRDPQVQHQAGQGCVLCTDRVVRGGQAGDHVEG